MSLIIMFDMLKEENIEILQPMDINFILTVIRDNCLNNETYNYINKLLGIDKKEMD